MRAITFIVAVCLILGTTGCSKDNADKPDIDQESKEGLVGISLQLHKNSSPDLNGLLESIDDVAPIGVNLFGMSPEWQELETAPNTFLFQDLIIKPLTLLDPDKTKLKSYILVLKIIDSNRKTVPSDLSENSFDDPIVINRFKSLIDGISILSEIGRVTHILIGNEVDGYLTMNSSELNAFSIFYQQIVDHVHTKIPSVKVGTIITFNSVVDNPIILTVSLRIVISSVTPITQRIAQTLIGRCAHQRKFIQIFCLWVRKQVTNHLLLLKSVILHQQKITPPNYYKNNL